MLKRINKHKLICAWLWICSFALSFPAQTGGNYTITQSIVASGGAASENGNFRVEGTVGQNTAGTVSVGAGGQYAVRGGFWATDALAPTAANTSLSGRITDFNGGGVARVQVLITDTTTGVTRSTQTNSFGFYRFDELATGQAYIVTARSRRFTFAPESHFINLFDENNETHFMVVGEGN